MGARKSDRIQFLDGLRGVAIIAVVLFHAYVYFPENLPFGDKFGVLPIRLGWQGVELFFLISGFVILMTLEGCRTFSEFARRRWLRLFPAMLIASVTTFLFCWLVAGERRPLADFVPGLTFTNPSLIHFLTGIRVSSMDAPYWSLYVEVVFYLSFGSAYLMIGELGSIFVVFALFSVSYLMTATYGLSLNGLPSRLAAATNLSGFIFFGWFASGSLFYLFYKTRSLGFLLVALATGFLSALSTTHPLIEQIGLLTVVCIFAAAAFSARVQAMLSSRILVFFGFVSYPLYLLHYTIIGVLQTNLARKAPAIPDVLYPLAPIALVVLAAWLVARFGEPSLRKLLILLTPDVRLDRREHAVLRAPDIRPDTGLDRT
jgi:peptidoglycan/LPS O-acetylase OafA/YrhL